MINRSRTHSSLFAVALAAVSAPAWAFPGFYATKGKKPAENLSTHVVVMQHGEDSAITVMPDYKGDLKPFALVMPVPDDVTEESVKVIKRNFVDRVDEISAPRFHEYWEKDPCEPGKAEQIWEIDLTAKSDTNFLGIQMPTGDAPKRKVAKELRLNVEAQYKQGEHHLHVLTPDSGAKDVVGWLEGKGYTAPEGAKAAIQKYVDRGMNVLVSEVDEKQVELVSGSRAILSPLRIATHKEVVIPSTLGTLNSGGMQELYVYVLAPKRRMGPKGYETVYPPTNISVDFKVKERMGEFYAGLHDLMLAKNPKAMIAEYAWSADGCGRPCPNEALMIDELLTLGADFFEEGVPEEERNPEPPEMTEEEEKALKALEEQEDKKKAKEDKKRFEADRVELARRKALLSRHDDYVLSRFHHRYDKAGLPKDIALQPVEHVKGGVGLPQGPEGEAPTEVKPASESELQARYNFFHPNKAVIKCDKPERWRWGKPWKTYRGLRKIWVAQDMATKNRTSIKPAQMVKTPVPWLGLAGVSAKPVPDGGAADAGAAAAAKKESDCGCRSVGSRAPAGGALASLGVALAFLSWRRRRGAVRS